MQRSDEELIERSLQTVLRLFPELRGSVDFTYVRRWPVALPQTRVGVYQRIAEFTSNIDPTARIQFAGDYLSQTGQNTAVAWGNRAAANLQKHHGLAGKGIHTKHEESTHG
jgi:protoporphyrinogen oxidase